MSGRNPRHRLVCLTLIAYRLSLIAYRLTPSKQKRLSPVLFCISNGMYVMECISQSAWEDLDHDVGKTKDLLGVIDLLLEKRAKLPFPGLAKEGLARG
jgi:hypothetical protein